MEQSPSINTEAMKPLTKSQVIIKLIDEALYEYDHPVIVIPETQA